LALAKRLRRKQTAAEQKLWKALRNRKLQGLKFRRQVPIESYVVDFYCAEKRLIVEVDGGVHTLKWRSDYIREQKLIKQGYRLIRVTNEQVKYNLTGILVNIILQT